MQEVLKSWVMTFYATFDESKEQDHDIIDVFGNFYSLYLFAKKSVPSMHFWNRMLLFCQMDSS
jgi:hypothetical protein